MTWAKFGTEFANECAESQLSSVAFRLHVEAIIYIYSIERNDLVLQKRLIRKWAGVDNWQPGVDELVSRGFWSEIQGGGGYIIRHHGDVIRQSLAAQAQKRDRDKKAQQKRRASADISADASADISADVAATQTDIQAARMEDRVSEQIDLTTGEVLSLEDDPWSRQSAKYPTCSEPGCTNTLHTAQLKSWGRCFVHHKEKAA